MRMSIFAAVSAVALMAGAAHAAPVVDTPAIVAQDPAFTDAELKQFGMAMDQLTAITQQVQGTPTDEQQAQMAAAVQNSGLTIERFNEISNAVSADPVLQARVAVAMAPASPAGSIGAEVSDEELAGFSAAMVELREISAGIEGGTPTPEQQTAMAEAVANSGLTIERFNAISNAVPSDDALRARVRLADARREAETSGAQ
ncbi:DUF4168 domain-containing protein [Brevundimonas poindexterae]|uniref:DUF4168 domain-containing protein n=1 Tax=Brevundimonas poindexterae TaxID=74325 RepID=UPI001CFC7DFA|nr:DUF4168 domain-containing protein [Brevundimonas poindexterae]